MKINNYRKEYIDITYNAEKVDKFGQKKEKLMKKPEAQFTLFLLIALLLPMLSSQGIVTNSFVFAIGNTMLYAIMATGFCLLLGYSGLASLGTAGFIGIGSYAGFYLMQEAGLPFGVVLIATIAIALIIGVIVGAISLRIEGIYLAILTLGLSEILRNTFISLKPTIKLDLSRVRLFGMKVGENVVYVLILVVFVALLFITSNIIRSKTGRALLSVKNSTSAAQAFGINLMYHRTLAFVISTIFAAIAGLLYMMYIRTMTSSTSTLLSMSTSLNILGAVIIGGAESLWGSALGVFIIYGLQSTFLSKIQFFVDNPAFITMITGVLIIVIVMFFPGGIAQMVKNIGIKVRIRKEEREIERRMEDYGKL